MKTLVLFFFAFAFSFTPLPSHSEARVFYAPEGNVSTLMVFEKGGFARGYGVFGNAAARMLYDDTVKVLDNLKFAVLIKSFVGSTTGIQQEMGALRTRSAESEIAFIQGAPVKFENDKASIKGQFIINGIRKDGAFETTLNKYARVSNERDLFDDGAHNLGLSLHTTIKRSDYGLSAGEGSPYNDETVLMLDIVASN